MNFKTADILDIKHQELVGHDVLTHSEKDYMNTLGTRKCIRLQPRIAVKVMRIIYVIHILDVSS